MLKDFRVTDSLGLKDFRVKGIWRSHDLGVKPSSACCELRMLQRDRVQWITAADTPSCGQKRHTRWPATNSKCWCAIMRSEKTHTLACNECFGMQWITGPQWIPSADVPSCGQKRHTRWPATNASACNELRMRYSTRTYPCVLPEKKRISMRTCSSMEWSLGLEQIKAKRILRLRDFRVKAS